MKGKSKLIVVLFSLVWIALVVLCCFLETNISREIYITTAAIVCLIIIALSFFCFFRSYRKNKKQVADIKEKYLKSLKPERPLRMFGYYEPEITTIPKVNVIEKDK